MGTRFAEQNSVENCLWRYSCAWRRTADHRYIFSRHRNEFDTVVVIGCDDDGVEHTFDFSSVLKHIAISPSKDENEHFDPTEVRALLLHELR